MSDNVWEKRSKAHEEQYFQKMEREQVRNLADKIHANELRTLISILPPNHNLTEQDLHKILAWKHAATEV